MPILPMSPTSPASPAPPSPSRLPYLRPVLLTLCLCCAPALAHDTPDDWVAVDDSRLEAARGGLDAGNGLILSLGVERLVSINGNVVASSNFTLSDVGKVVAGHGALAGDALAALTLVQNGAGNVFDATLTGQAAGALVIQNSASDQLIRSQTTISTVVNSLSLLKSLNFEGGLRDALSNAVRPK
ncbi:hypothetical protein [Rugamonas apoptosis]|uniref:hypothetical protein n=1 Tax=Rugamonas apoptosis TaxID=2758570 RepID=UPI001E60BF8B|nr:hypothetical protein [Rugamonas apoptosis]